MSIILTEVSHTLVKKLINKIMPTNLSIAQCQMIEQLCLTAFLREPDTYNHYVTESLLQSKYASKDFSHAVWKNMLNYRSYPSSLKK